jgi:hypothetical protein
MKFLVKMEVGIVPMPPEEGLLLTLATLDYWDAIMKSGKVSGGSFVEGNGGGGIIETESLEELASILGGAPNAGIATYEVRGLTSMDAARELISQQLEALKKAGK